MRKKYRTARFSVKNRIEIDFSAAEGLAVVATVLPADAQYPVGQTASYAVPGDQAVGRVTIRGRGLVAKAVLTGTL